MTEPSPHPSCLVLINNPEWKLVRPFRWWWMSQGMDDRSYHFVVRHLVISFPALSSPDIWALACPVLTQQWSQSMFCWHLIWFIYSRGRMYPLIHFWKWTSTQDQLLDKCFCFVLFLGGCLLKYISSDLRIWS